MTAHYFFTAHPFAPLLLCLAFVGFYVALTALDLHLFNARMGHAQTFTVPPKYAFLPLGGIVWWWRTRR